jgi:hypothetical protein
MFYSTYLPKTHNFASSLNMLYTAESAQFYSAFSPTISLTPCFGRKRKKFDSAFSPKMFETIRKRTVAMTSAKFNFAFLATTLSYASRFWRKRRVIENFKYLIEFEEYFRKCWLYCVLYLYVTERCQKNFQNRL